VAGAPSFPDVSSSEIRSRLQRGEPVDHLVPTEVLAAWLGRADEA
jgi:nicotinic acid mononucleotide adenylyltransferase